jgi:parvulin-like peptidyl-prolyl isomerase
MPSESGKSPVLHKKHVARLERERQQSKLILYIFIGILVLVVLLVGYGILDQTYLQLRQPIAKINETSIPLKDFEARVKLQRQQLLGQYNQLLNMYNQYNQFAQATGMDLSQQMQQFEAQAQQIQSTLDAPVNVGQSVLDQMINEQVIRDEAAKRGITVSKEELDEEVKGFFLYYPNGTPVPSATPTQFNTPPVPAEAFDIVTMTPTQPATATPESTATLAATPTLASDATAEPTSTPEPTATPYTREAFEKNYGTEVTGMDKFGINEDAYRALFELQILERKVKDAVTADVARSEQQVWARHILVADEPVAKSVIERLNDGEDFATVAKELSTDTGTAVNGGDLGWFGKGMMVDEFETAAYALENSGDFTSEPVKSQFGYHIIQLIAKREQPLTDDQYRSARETAFRDWLESVKAEYTIETFDIWQERVPSEPNFVTIATESAINQLTAIAEQKATEKAAEKESTPTP